MRTAFPALLSGLMAFFIACQLPDDNSQAVSASNRAVLRARQAGVPLSLIARDGGRYTLATPDGEVLVEGQRWRRHLVFGVKVRIDNREGKLKAGMAADVTLEK
mgnify:CR=1 FL=1